MGNMMNNRFRRYGTIIACSLVLLFFSACGEMEEGAYSGVYGPGVGGTPVSASTTVLPLATDLDTPIGQLTYDGVYFFSGPPVDPSQTAILATLLPPAGDGIVVSIRPIVQRPDTPCRFFAAIMARDMGYQILGSGDRTNDSGLEFHQVNLSGDGAFFSFHCAIVSDPLGVMLAVSAPEEAMLSYLQIHHLFNTISP